MEKVDTASSPTRFTGLAVAFGYSSVSMAGTSIIAPGAVLAMPPVIGIGIDGAIRR